MGKKRRAGDTDSIDGDDGNPAPLKASMPKATLKVRTEGRLLRIVELLSQIETNLAHERPILCWPKQLRAKSSDILCGEDGAVFTDSVFVASHVRCIAALDGIKTESIAIPFLNFKRRISDLDSLKDITGDLDDFFKKFSQDEGATATTIVNQIASAAEEMLLCVESMHHVLVDQLVTGVDADVDFICTPKNRRIRSTIDGKGILEKVTRTLRDAEPGQTFGVQVRRAANPMAMRMSEDQNTVKGTVRISECGYRYADNLLVGKTEYNHAPKLTFKNVLQAGELDEVTRATETIKEICGRNNIALS